VSKEQIMGQLYGIEDGPDPRVIDVFVCKMRAKFQEAGAPDNLISTMRGRGFMLEIDSQTEEVMPLPISDKIVPLDIRRAA
jgi:DNA-binding response OmpR family regulator